MTTDHAAGASHPVDGAPSAEPPQTSAPPQTDRATLRRVVISGAIGNFVEWYDLAIYAYATVAISKAFFPAGDSQFAIIATFFMFAVTYAVRPISGIFMGTLGDRLGRKKLLVFSILLMAAGTTTIGLIPDYATIGILAPILLFVCRAAQGVAAGGEFVGAATYVYEYAPPRRRGLLLGLIQMGTGLCYPAAAAVAFLLAQWFGDEAFIDGVWRVMFLLSAPLALVAVFIRMRLAESPVFKELAANNGLARHPLKEALTANPRRLLSGTLYMIGYFGGAIMLLFFMPTYLTKDLGMAVTDTSLLMAGATLTFALLIPIFGWLTDILTRFQARVLSTSLHALISLPAFLLISGNATGAIVFGLILLATLQAFYYAIGPLTVVDIFPARIRFTSGTIVMNVPAAIVPAILPPLAAVATTMTGLSFAPALVAVGLSLVGLIGAVGLRSAGQPTR